MERWELDLAIVCSTMLRAQARAYNEATRREHLFAPWLFKLSAID
jgi:hypothetical protein